jgi:hypothetical protein
MIRLMEASVIPRMPKIGGLVIRVVLMLRGTDRLPAGAELQGAARRLSTL